jgi:hypothetical protein
MDSIREVRAMHVARTVGWALAAGILWLAASAAAVPLVFQEPVGQFPPDDFPCCGPVLLGTLDVGVNTISGDTHDGDRPGRAADEDVFSVMLPAGLSITSITLAVSSYIDNTPTRRSSISLLAPSIGSESFGCNGDCGTILVSPYLISGSTIAFLVQGNQEFVDPPGFVTTDTFVYTLSLTVVVPEPAAAVLVASGLTVAAFAARRSGARGWRS